VVLRPREEFKIYQRVFDNYTINTLLALKRKKYFDTLDYPISTGKEADVYRATGTIEGKKTYLAVKIYRIETSNFKAMLDYLIGDPLFEGVKKTKRGIISTWCKKEFKNLTEAFKVKVKVPEPIKAMNNVLIMKLVGDRKGNPSPLLKDLKTADYDKIIPTVTKYIKVLWTKAKIVHGDINEFNILMKNNTPYLIDMAQAMSIKHPMALELLQRDLRNLKKIAVKHGVEFDYEKVLRSLIRP